MSEETAPKKRGRQKAQASPAAPTQGEMVVSIPLTELHPFPNHPFQVRDEGYAQVLTAEKRGDIRIRRYARVIEGHILPEKPSKRRHGRR